ncbi:uncharacterized protein MELLADRAFT_79852 [Melampsora larici-populina 98AG31]|uniref:CxC1-like cysteine cluster associated with KDZ transposases domain-containing protein n=1 Tax=Melampsora larici-populina (strain 98AG31 / pathotype 3-4-7) TaxID=747676 RepID=F4SDY2_MELLP|nr:uncharacterized protein MELLADRAFT_79852 [Melampsora larici-populina 98AG31]EGF97144.1 hypothetical protein MELLADRAFT_79852 [Melampsora larici-populina 98AG31]
MAKKTDRSNNHDVHLFAKQERKRRKTVQRITDTPDQVKDVGVRLGIIPPPPSGSAPQQPPVGGDDEDAIDDDNDDAWIDVTDVPEYVQNLSRPHSPAPPTIDDDCNNFYIKHKGWSRICERDRREKKWKTLRLRLITTYLERQHQTINWTSAPSYIEDYPVICSCSRSQICTREVDLIDIGRRTSKQLLVFCQCIPDPIRLMHYGYFAGSPDSPSTAFSVAFVELYQEIWKLTASSLSGFLGGLMGFGNLRSKKYLCPRNRPHTLLIKLEASKLFYPISVLEDILKSFPDKRVAVLYDIGCHLEAHIQKELTAGSGKWLSKKYHNAARVFTLAKFELDSLFKSVNPATGRKYSISFLERQWVSEREAQASKSHHMDQLRLTLGNLLCSRDRLKEVWKTTVSPEHAEAHMRTAHNLNQQILEASQKVGSAGNTHFANKTHQEVMLKLWSSKHELRKKFIELKEQKRPMEVSRSNGRTSNLGVNRTSIVVTSVQRHALALKKFLDCYLIQLEDYRKVFPTNIVPDPATMNLDRLLKLEADSPFWNDGFITHAHEPWAVDPKTQHGMRQLAYFQRSKEELRRIGWEIRRSMRWATRRHQSLLRLFKELRDFNSELTSAQAKSLLVSLPSRVAVTSIIHTELLKVFHLQELWHDPLMDILFRTDFQQGDQDLLYLWKQQVLWISLMREKGELSLIPGDFACMPQEPPNNLPDLFEVEVQDEQRNTFQFPDGDSDAGLATEDEEDEDNRMLGALNEEDMTAGLNVLSLNDIPEEQPEEILMA